MTKQAQKPVEVTLRVAAYLRVSTDEQAESGLGLGVQEEKIRAMCVVKGWPMPTLYIDVGVTGTIDLPERPAGSRLLDDIKAGKIDAVIVAALEQRGRTVGIKAGLPPYGYRYEGKDVLIIDEQAETVRKVYALHAAGLSLRAIAEQVPLSFKAVAKVLAREAMYRGGLRGESTEKWPVILA